jgi:hypothetical protein
MRSRFLFAALAAVIFANLLVFGALQNNYFKPTPRPPRVIHRITFTPNPVLAKRLVTPTFTPLPTATRGPTPLPPVPFGGPVE